ncbi:DUF2634 domain-containing protein [Brevibacillus dissolubilis]|uniref:DUF2634 domain-containing protein n=1 Tax=Brevibacillus dissolubilis TaxID=1844116 RepID=UPI0011167BFD|nr:DUF2634 domain-containing protein [Brevibacillus dissolubilis]
MALEPDLVFPQIIENVRQPSKTYQLDIETGEITARIDGRQAIEQFITKAIHTIRFHVPIYSPDYGCEIQSLFGRGFSERFIRAEIVRMVTEALIYDDRIERVSDFEVKAEADEVYLSFRVDTVEGVIHYKEVI